MPSPLPTDYVAPVEDPIVPDDHINGL
jgi:hypothetical protein